MRTIPSSTPWRWCYSNVLSLTSSFTTSRDLVSVRVHTNTLQCRIIRDNEDNVSCFDLPLNDIFKTGVIESAVVLLDLALIDDDYNGLPKVSVVLHNQCSIVLAYISLEYHCIDVQYSVPIQHNVYQAVLVNGPSMVFIDGNKCYVVAQQFEAGTKCQWIRSSMNLAQTTKIFDAFAVPRCGALCTVVTLSLPTPSPAFHLVELDSISHRLVPSGSVTLPINVLSSIECVAFLPHTLDAGFSCVLGVAEPAPRILVVHRNSVVAQRAIQQVPKTIVTSPKAVFILLRDSRLLVLDVTLQIQLASHSNVCHIMNDGNGHALLSFDSMCENVSTVPTTVSSTNSNEHVAKISQSLHMRFQKGCAQLETSANLLQLKKSLLHHTQEILADNTANTKSLIAALPDLVPLVGHNKQHIPLHDDDEMYVERNSGKSRPDLRVCSLVVCASAADHIVLEAVLTNTSSCTAHRVALMLMCCEPALASRSQCCIELHTQQYISLCIRANLPTSSVSLSRTLSAMFTILFLADKNNTTQPTIIDIAELNLPIGMERKTPLVLFDDSSTNSPNRVFPVNVPLILSDETPIMISTLIPSLKPMVACDSIPHRTTFVSSSSLLSKSYPSIQVESTFWNLELALHIHTESLVDACSTVAELSSNAAQSMQLAVDWSSQAICAHARRLIIALRNENEHLFESLTNIVASISHAEDADARIQMLNKFRRVFVEFRRHHIQLQANSDILAARLSGVLYNSTLLHEKPP